ncbi:MAG: NADH-quinone oxidoreductase subunit N [Gemmatimonadota bacterium]|nr:MAG: NADH-quinone oxidoreductase subunit N [Gemmatimonadota bacterium]
MGMAIDVSVPGGMVLALLPELLLVGWMLVLLLAVAWRHKDEGDQQLAGQLALVGLVSTLLVVLWMWLRDAHAESLVGMIALDGFRYATSAIFLIGAILVVMLSLGYLGRESILTPEYYVLVLLATVGMLFMSSGADLIVIFLGLELMSVSIYVLAGIDRRSAFSAEAAVKYFLLGAFASGFFLYGVALLYGATGTTNLTQMHLQITSLGLETNLMLLCGIGLLLIGFGFKVAAVPFHMWAPDVYDGAPTPITAFMAAAVKAAAFAALIRVLLHALVASDVVWTEIVFWLSAITMIVGNLVALAQTQLKRMLAYSSIGHAGYILAAVASGSEEGAKAFVFYVLVYTLMTLGAFGVLAAIGRRGERDVRVDDLSGLGSRRPWMALAMTVFMLSLLGFPGTAGFIGKWLVLSSVVQADQVILAVLLVLASVVSAGYYLPVVMAMYMRPAAAEDSHSGAQLTGAARWVVGVAAVLLLLLGVWPNRAMDVAADGAEGLRPAPTRVFTD